jgi:hypothetical protein
MINGRDKSGPYNTGYKLPFFDRKMVHMKIINYLAESAAERGTFCAGHEPRFIAREGRDPIYRVRFFGITCIQTPQIPPRKK